MELSTAHQQSLLVQIANEREQKRQQFRRLVETEESYREDELSKHRRGKDVFSIDPSCNKCAISWSSAVPMIELEDEMHRHYGERRSRKCKAVEEDE